jgi:glycosyltransferase involved in cell wall biosynthesis
MDDQALIRTYGNTDLAEGTEERPLVTFALFAFNQEKYIREAVEGALSQTYTPLEIILSDDCSSDRTFSIIQEMALSYKGPHQVRIVRTKENLGLTRHFWLRCREAKGEIIVVAAGDDISKPKRCEYHVQSYRDLSVMGVSSGYDLIDESGCMISEKNIGPMSTQAVTMQPKLFSKIDHPYVVIQGSTASYRKKMFACKLPDREIGCSEDNLMNFLIYLQGFKVEQIGRALIKYRQHPSATANYSKKDLSAEEVEVLLQKQAEQELNKMESFEWIARNEGFDHILNLAEIRRRKEVARDVANWRKTKFASRSVSFLKSAFKRDWLMVKWKGIRLCGHFPRYQPKLFTYHFRKLR